jgi:peptidoglycan/LPS O-acetylase OafA/YrhL
LRFYGALLVLFAAAVWLPCQEVWFGEHLEFLTAGIPALLVLIAAIVLELRYRFFGRSRWVLILGEASYILYLVHQFVVFGVIRMGLKSAVHWSEWVKWPLIGAMLVVASAVAMVLHLYIEKPTMKWLRRRLVHETQAVIFQAP